MRNAPPARRPESARAAPSAAKLGAGESISVDKSGQCAAPALTTIAASDSKSLPGNNDWTGESLMSVMFSIVARLRHNVLLTFSPGYRQVRERLRQISDHPR